MKLSLNAQPKDALIWVYQANQMITEEIADKIQSFAEDFLNDWESHGKPIMGSVEVKHDLFLVIAASSDDDNMCGRAKDAQLKFVKALEKETGVTLTDRMQMAYKKDGKIVRASFNELNNLVKEGEVTAETIVYNNLVANYDEFTTNWETEAKNSWHSQFLN